MQTSNTSTFSASTLGELNIAIQQANQAAAGSTVIINLIDNGTAASITLASGDVIQMLNSAANVIIQGPNTANAVIDGAHIARGFIVLSGTVAFKYLTIQNCLARGINGNMGAGGAVLALNPYGTALSAPPWTHGDGSAVTKSTSLSFYQSLIQSCRAKAEAPTEISAISGTGGKGGGDESFGFGPNYGSQGVNAYQASPVAPVINGSQFAPAGMSGNGGQGGVGGYYNGGLLPNSPGTPGTSGGPGLFGGAGGTGGCGGGGGGGGCGACTNGIGDDCGNSGCGGAQGGAGANGGQGGFGSGGGGGGSGGGGGGGGAGGTNGFWDCGSGGGQGGAQGSFGVGGSPGFGGSAGASGRGNPGQWGNSGSGGSNRPGGAGGAACGAGDNGVGAGFGGAIFVMGGTEDQWQGNPSLAPTLTLERVTFNGNSASSPGSSAGADIFLQGFGQLSINGEGTTVPQWCDESHSGIASNSNAQTDAYGFPIGGGAGIWTLNTNAAQASTAAAHIEGADRP